MITQDGINSIITGVASAITAARYRIGTTWHNATGVTVQAQTAAGRVAVMFTMTGSAGETVNAIEIYAGDMLFAQKETDVTFASGVTSINYIYGLPISEVQQNGI